MGLYKDFLISFHYCYVKMSNSQEFQSTEVKKNQMDMTYLITYSRADLELFPTRESFGLATAEAFDSGTSKVKVVYWASALENHQDGRKHFHLALKLSELKWWLSVENVLSTTYDIDLTFLSCMITTIVLTSTLQRQTLRSFTVGNTPTQKK